MIVEVGVLVKVVLVEEKLGVMLEIIAVGRQAVLLLEAMIVPMAEETGNIAIDVAAKTPAAPPAAATMDGLEVFRPLTVLVVT